MRSEKSWQIELLAKQGGQSKAINICRRQQRIGSQILPGNEVALENLACCGRGQKKDQESLHFRNCFQLTNHLLTYRLLCDAISDHLLLEVCCIGLTVASNQFSLVVIIGNLFSTQDCISWPTTESGGQSVQGGDQRGTGLHRQGGGLWICPRGNSISPVRERTHSHSVWRVTEMPSHNPRLFLVSSSHHWLLNNNLQHCIGGGRTGDFFEVVEQILFYWAGNNLITKHFFYKINK